MTSYVLRLALAVAVVTALPSWAFAQDSPTPTQILRERYHQLEREVADAAAKLKQVQIYTLAFPIDHAIGHMMKLPPDH